MTSKDTFYLAIIIILGIMLLLQKCNGTKCEVTQIDTLIQIQRDTIIQTIASPTVIEEKRIPFTVTKFRDTCDGKIYDSDTICREYIAFLDSFYRARTYSDTSFSDSSIYIKYTAYVRGRMDSISLERFIKPVKVTIPVRTVQYNRIYAGLGFTQVGAQGVITLEADLSHKQWLFGAKYGKDFIGGKVGVSIFKWKGK